MTLQEFKKTMVGMGPNLQREGTFVDPLSNLVLSQQRLPALPEQEKLYVQTNPLLSCYSPY